MFFSNLAFVYFHKYEVILLSASSRDHYHYHHSYVNPYHPQCICIFNSFFAGHTFHLTSYSTICTETLSFVDHTFHLTTYSAICICTKGDQRCVICTNVSFIIFISIFIITFVRALVSLFSQLSSRHHQPHHHYYYFAIIIITILPTAIQNTPFKLHVNKDKCSMKVKVNK